MLNKISHSFWFQIIPAFLLGVLAVILLLAGVVPLYYLWFTGIMWSLTCGLGVAVGYHRVFSHATHKLPTWKENIILFFAILSGQGSSIPWVALHRGYHHPHADTPKDIHSPVVYGKWAAFWGWQKQLTTQSNLINMKYAVDLLRKPNHLFFHKYGLLILWGVPLLVALINWEFALVAICLSTCIGVLQDNIVNVICHSTFTFNYRNFDTNDNSQNNIIMGFLCWGQGWHNNHHYNKASYDFGKTISGKWWEYDPCLLWKWFL